ncbi:MAG: hypothetical protein AAB553_07360 [Patescibacteria group bacterium]
MTIAIKLKKGFKQLVLAQTILSLVLLSVFVLPARAATTASVTATVTVQNISVAVSDGTVSYGTLALNTSGGTNGSDTQTATNDGNVTVDFNVRGQNTAAWTLGATAGSNQYVHRFCVATCGSAPTNYTALTTSYQTLASSKAASATQTFDLHITTPTSTSSYAQQSVDITVQAATP